MTAPARLLRSPLPASAGQFGRFLLVGLSNTALSLLVYDGLLLAGARYLGDSPRGTVPALIAGSLAFAAGAVNGYVLNRRWTFAAPDSRAARVRYVTVQLCGLAATTALLWLFVVDVGVDRLWAYALTIPVVTVATFLANRGWTFQRPT